MPSAAASLLPGSESTVNVSALVSAVVSEPSGRCGLTARSRTPRASSAGRTRSSYVRSVRLQYGHQAPR
ncbi:hypothetical protein GA0115246_1148135 [Streptomyces sp. SolWspMP-sol7th]|nr:hypothetical protein GA0115246_1148135 [Streptomyces sp. SolWspMP-sol7th]